MKEGKNLKIVICDYKTDLNRDLQYELDRLNRELDHPEVVVYEYQDNKAELISVLRDADAVIDTYVELDREVLSQTKNLKCIALNAMGFNMVDVDAATEFGIPVCPASAYCTNEVAEHTIALLFALCRGLRTYTRDVDNHIWDYTRAGALERISGKTIAIFGFGRIGQAVGTRARAMGMEILAVDPYLPQSVADSLNVRLVTPDEVWSSADFISNHMVLTAETTKYFNMEKFSRCKKQPIFINAGRGGSVNEADLVEALDRGYLRAAGLDVLDSENPDLAHSPLVGRNDVIITPHVAFYSKQAAKDLQDISCNSVVAALQGNYNKVAFIVNRDKLHLEKGNNASKPVAS